MMKEIYKTHPDYVKKPKKGADEERALSWEDPIEDFAGDMGSLGHLAANHHFDEFNDQFEVIEDEQIEAQIKQQRDVGMYRES